MANEYATVAQVRARLGLDDAREDGVLAEILEMVSRWIDEYTHRRFFRASETRYFTYDGRHGVGCLYVGDYGTITSLKTDDDADRTYATTWDIAGADADVDFEPYNAALDSKPYTHIRITPNGDFAFPTVAKGVEVIATFGYSTIDAVPPQVREACILQTIRNFARKNTAFGVFGMPQAGTATFISKLDPDVEDKLTQFRLVVVA